MITPAHPSPDRGSVPQRLLERTVAVLEAMTAAGEPVGPRGLARASGIDRSAVSRILQQLTELGVLDRSESGYVPGSRLFAMDRLLVSLDNLPTAANAVLKGLLARFDETCYVCVRHGDSAVYLYVAQSSKPLRYVVDLGRPVPLHAGAAGRAILAGMEDDQRIELPSHALLAPLTPATITDRNTPVELARSDEVRGFSASFAERVEGGVAFGAPFFDYTSRCAGSVVFTAPVTRIAVDRVDDIGRAVAHAAAILSTRLGRS